MEKPQSLPDLIAAAQANAKILADRINSADAADQHDTVALELAAVDAFTLFEARMQHHFKRGPFSRKLRAALLDAKLPDLADRIHKHYLAVNVLKHGTGASYRELLNNKSTLITVKPSTETPTDNSTGLIDVTVPGFFDRLAATLLDAYRFLENK